MSEEQAEIKVPENFEDVWARVRSDEKKPPDIGAKLRHFMNGEAAKRRLYLLLIKKSRGSERAALASMCAQTERCLKELEIEHFLLTGDSHTVAVSQIHFEGFLSALRTLYISEELSAAELFSAAECESGSVSQALGCAARAAEKKKDSLRGMITRAMS